MEILRSTRPPPALNSPAPPGYAAWLWPLAVLATALVGGLASSQAAELYARLDRPGWAPPASWFGPVWALLYLSMATAASWVARSAVSQPDEVQAQRRGLWLFGLGLIPNALWSWCFFAWQRADWAMATLLLLLALLAATVYAFGQVRRGAAWLLLPLLIWVSFAAVLNVDLLLRNGSRLGA